MSRLVRRERRGPPRVALCGLLIAASSCSAQSETVQGLEGAPEHAGSGLSEASQDTLSPRVAAEDSDALDAPEVIGSEDVRGDHERAEQPEPTPQLHVAVTARTLDVNVVRGHDELQHLRLVLTDPDGRQHWSQLPAEEALQVHIAQVTDGAVTDGIYKYEVAPLRGLVSGAMAGTLAPRLPGQSLRELARQRLTETPSAPPVALDQNGRDADHAVPGVFATWTPTTGTFRVQDGSIVLPEEEPTSGATSAAASMKPQQWILDQRGVGADSDSAPGQVVESAKEER